MDAGEHPVARTVWVVTEAKSGTNLLLQLCELVAWHGDFAHIAAAGHIHDLVPWPDAPMPYTVSYDEGVRRAVQQSPTQLAVVKTHLRLEQLRFRKHRSGAKFICVCRDPKDITVSAYHFGASVFAGPAQLPLAACARTACEADLVPCQWWAERIAFEWAEREKDDVLFLFYEDVVSKKRETVVQVAAFLDVALSDEQIEQIVELTSLDFMKRNTRYVDAGAQSVLAYGGDMVRSGRAHGGKAGLSADERKQIDEAMSSQLAALQSDFPFRERYVRP